MKRNMTTAIKYNLLKDKDKEFLIEGTLFEIKNENPYTKSDNHYRQWMALIKNIKIFTSNNDFIIVDHMWLFGCKKIIELQDYQNNPTIKIYGKINTYTHNNEVKWTLKFPYSKLQINKNII